MANEEIYEELDIGEEQVSSNECWDVDEADEIDAPVYVGVVTAMDITNDIAHGCDAQALVDALVNSRDPRIKYIIWNRKKVNSRIQPWVWRDYTGANPHTKHFHLSVRPEKSAYDSEESWQI